MARSYNFGQIWNIIARSVNRQVEDSSAATICNLAQDLIWNGYDWRESLLQLPPFWLIPNEQDYGPPVYSVPADFLGLRWAWLVNMQSSPVSRMEMSVLHDLSLTHIKALPHAISYEPTTQCFRIFHRAPDNIGSTQYMIDGTYKKRPTIITSQNLANTTLPFDDLYLPVWIEAMRWGAFNLAGDPRADKQLEKALGFIDAMADNEGMNLGDYNVHPSEALAWTSNSGGSFSTRGYPGFGL
jgi:hypothetical protein